MGLTVKSSEQSAGKWAERAAGASNLMAEGAAANADKWLTNTTKAADNFGMAITAANMKQRFAAGVRKAGVNKFASRIREVAAGRYSQGVGVAGDDYKAGIEPYLSTLASLTLTARKPRGDPSNYRRVEEVGRALNQKRIAMLSVGG